jgi:hypothetical protein
MKGGIVILHGDFSPASIFWELKRAANYEQQPPETSVEKDAGMHVEWLRHNYMQYLVHVWLVKKIN